MKKKTGGNRLFLRKMVGGWTLKILLVGAMTTFWCSPVAAIDLLNPRQWDNSEITSIQTNVDTIKNSLQPSGDLRTVAQDLRDQLQNWGPYQDKTALLTETVEDILNWLDTRYDAYIDFVGGDLSNKCPSSSECGVLRSDLITFFEDLSNLPPEIEAIQKFGFRDAAIARKIISNMPPILLFALNDKFKNISEWQLIPADINDIFNEIDDPEVFSLRLNEAEGLGVAAINQVGPLARTKTQRFCRLRADRLDGDRVFDGVDPVRLNRLNIILTSFEATLSAACDSLPDDIDLSGTVLGEGAGSAAPDVLKIILCASAAVPKIIAQAINTHRANIGLCLDRYAEIEDRLASCALYSDFTLDEAANEEYYDLVLRRLTTAFNNDIPTSKSVKEYTDSTDFLAAGNYGAAYQHLCLSYTKIGSGDACDPVQATDATNPVECNDQGAENCSDGVDNDGDGKIDCNDRLDCRRDPACN